MGITKHKVSFIYYAEGRAETEDAWTWRHIFFSFFHNSSLPSFLEDDVRFSVLVDGLKHFSMHCAVITEAHSLLNDQCQSYNSEDIFYYIIPSCMWRCCFQLSQECPSFQDILQTWHGKISVDTPTITLSKRLSLTQRIAIQAQNNHGNPYLICHSLWHCDTH